MDGDNLLQRLLLFMILLLASAAFSGTLTALSALSEAALTKESEEGNKRDSEANGKKVTITIQSGQYSESVSAACEQAGLVKSATEFNKYLCDNGYSNKLRVGDHEIAMGASYEEIAKALCGG